MRPAKWLPRSLAFAAVLMLLAARQAATMEDVEVVKKQELQQQTEALRQIAIMAKVLETRLRDELAGGLVIGDVIRRGGVRGFHVPGVGAVFQFNVSFPLAEPKANEKPDEPAPDDLWSRIERGEPASPAGSPVIGLAPGGAGKALGAHKPALAQPLSRDDKRRIENLEAIVLETLAGYGQRMAALAPHENLVVLVGGGLSGGADRVLSIEATDLGVLMHDPFSRGEAVEWLSDDLLADDREKNANQQAQEKDYRNALKVLDDRLRKIEKELKEPLDQSDAAKLRDQVQELVELQQAWVKAYEDLIDQTRSRVEQPKRYTRSVRLSGQTAPATSWILKVRKSDLVEDAKKLREVAVIENH